MNILILLSNNGSSTTMLFSVSEIGDSEVVFGEMGEGFAVG